MLDPAHEQDTATDEELVAHMDIGDQAEKFIASELGRTMLGIAAQQVQEALDQLKTVSPFDQRQISELQSRVWRAESFAGWLVDLASRGREAYSEFRDRKGDA